MTEIDGLDFETAWQNRELVEIDGQTIPVMALTDVLTNKRASGRPKDLADVAWIERRMKRGE